MTDIDSPPRRLGHHALTISQTRINAGPSILNISPAPKPKLTPLSTSFVLPSSSRRRLLEVRCTSVNSGTFCRRDSMLVSSIPAAAMMSTFRGRDGSLAYVTRSTSSAAPSIAFFSCPLRCQLVGITSLLRNEPRQDSRYAPYRRNVIKCCTVSTSMPGVQLDAYPDASPV